MDYEAAKRMEDFAKEILRQTPAMQKKMWEALEPVLTADEIHGLKCYVGLFHMFTDQRYFDEVTRAERKGSMETVKFTIIVVSPDMCRIVPHDIRSKFKEIADGGCICSLDVMIAEMEHITKKCAEIGVAALFEM